jgi:signal transduction histidine kinase
LLAVQHILSESIEVSRTLTHELSPPVLYQENLDEILLWLGRWYGEKHGLAVEVEIEQSVELGLEEIRVTLFRSVLELLFNVVKHARVKAARVSLSRTLERAVRVVVSDEGVGFDPAQLRLRTGTDKGFGLFHLRERLELIGGALEIESAPGRGSRFALTVPLPF